MSRRVFVEAVMESRTSKTSQSAMEPYRSVSPYYQTNSEPSTIQGEDVTMKQIATARETFSDLETAYRKFKLELDYVKEEHRNEV